MEILDFKSREPKKIMPKEAADNEAVYATDDNEFVISVITFTKKDWYIKDQSGGVQKY